MKNRKQKLAGMTRVLKRGTAWMLVCSILFQTMVVSAQEISKGPPGNTSENTAVVITGDMDSEDVQNSQEVKGINKSIIIKRRGRKNRARADNGSVVRI